MGLSFDLRKTLGVLPMLGALWCVYVPVSVAVWVLCLPYRLAQWLLGAAPRQAARLGALAVHVTEPVEGPSKGAVVLVHGWPDSHVLWDAQVALLAGEGYRCLAVDLPGFAKGEGHPALYSVADLAELLHATLPKYVEKGEKVDLLLHDWGCLVGFAYQKRHPEAVARVVALDVAGLEPAFHAVLFVLVYQAYLALAYMLGGAPGALMNQLLLKFFAYQGRPQRELVPHMNGLYYATLKGMATGAEPLRFAPYKVCPLFFGYGTLKPIRFHTDAFLAGIRDAGNGSVAKAYKSSHWITCDCPGQCNDDLIGFLRDTPKK